MTKIYRKLKGDVPTSWSSDACIWRLSTQDPTPHDAPDS